MVVEERGREFADQSLRKARLLKLLNYFPREDMENVSDVAGEEKLERLPISKIGKSKSEEVDVTGDRSSTGTSGEIIRIFC